MAMKANRQTQTYQPVRWKKPTVQVNVKPSTRIRFDKARAKFGVVTAGTLFEAMLSNWEQLNRETQIRIILGAAFGDK